MHTSRTALLVTGGLGMISTLFVWRLYDQVAEKAADSGLQGMLQNANLSAEKVAQTGIDTKFGFGTLVLFLIMVLVAMMGKREETIKTGTQKFTLLIISATTLIYHIVVISLFLLSKYNEPAYGVYTAFALSFAALVIPYLFKPSGDFGAMTPKEIVQDIEDSAEEFEDKVDDIGDHLEDNIESAFKKKPEEQEEGKSAESSTEEGADSGAETSEENPKEGE